jgi:2-dehydro-3-deoxyphosphogluconate aldolase/(4S)-4-hydroxy-2-oxoglutarate aldolase
VTKKELFETLYGYGVVPVISIADAELALPLADALIKGGLPVAEITFRTAAAGEVIAALNKERPDLILGAGTILSVENLRLAKEYGAQFGVAPGLNPEIVKEAQRVDLPFAPGVVTPSEIERAIGLGAGILKFFPAEASGGVGMLRALAGPYAHLGIRFMPTGGVNSSNLEGYLSSDAVLAVGGSWVARRDVIAAEEWDEISENCRQVRELVDRLRRGAA